VVPDRVTLERAYAAAEQRWMDRPVDRPVHWGGYRVLPQSVEFWQGRPDRLHDRLRYRLDGAVWVVERRAP
jgi:pyridoxamine 5'-phosphate oxidase